MVANDRVKRQVVGRINVDRNRLAAHDNKFSLLRVEIAEWNRRDLADTLLARADGCGEHLTIFPHEASQRLRRNLKVSRQFRYFPKRWCLDQFHRAGARNAD